MLGAITGDICGSPYEFIKYEVPYNFPLFNRGCGFTDDTVLTMAVAEALILCYDNIDDEITFKQTLVDLFKQYGRRYPHAGYGGKFIRWIFDEKSEPYNSYGNGSAMRVSPVGWVFDDVETTRKVARWTAEVTHNHPEGIKAAECTAAVIFLARIGWHKNDIEEYVVSEFGYDTDKIPDSEFVSCQSTMPICLHALYSSNCFEDAIRNAISFGYDTDTYGAITGSMAEAYYGIDNQTAVETFEYLPYAFIDIIEQFSKIRRKVKDGFHDV